MKKSIYGLLPSVSLLALFLPSQVSAEILYSQDFESLAPVALGGQAGFVTGTGPANVATGGLTYTGEFVSVPGGTQDVALNSTGANNWAFSNTFTSQSGTVYFSVALTWTGQDFDDFLYFALSDDVRTSVPVALGNSGGIVINRFAGQFQDGRIGGRIRNDTTTNTTQTGSSVVGGANPSNTQFIVASLSKSGDGNYDTLKLWANPSSATEGTPSVTITQDMGIASGLDTFFFFTGANNEAGDLIKLDSIKIGTTYAAVGGNSTGTDPDSDNDGLPNAWEEAYFGAGNLSQGAEDDFEGDGTDNLTEFRLGLIPNSGSSRFAAVRDSGGVITWPSATGVTFKVWRSTSLADGSWEDMGNVPGTAITATYTDPSPPAGAAFYRVALLP